MPLGLELLVRSDVSEGLHRVLIPIAALRLLFALAALRRLKLHLIKEVTLRGGCLNEIIKLKFSFYHCSVA